MKSSFSAVFSLLLIFALFLFTINGAWADTALEQSMQQMGKAYKELANDLKQPQEANKDQYIALATTIKEQAKASHDLVPKLAKTLPDDQRNAMVQSYQKDMDKFAQDIDSLSNALKNAKWDDARALMDTLKQDMFAGHKQYRVQKHGQSSSPSAPPVPASNSVPSTNAPAQ